MCRCDKEIDDITEEEMAEALDVEEAVYNINDEAELMVENPCEIFS